MDSQTSAAGHNGHANGNGNGNSHVDRNGPVPVVPIPLDGMPGIPARRNVDEWFKDAQEGSDCALELSLFIRAMTKFQTLEPQDQLSYFRIAGIHGLPRNVSWNMGLEPIPRSDAQMDNRIANGEGGFYCTHNQYRFGTWHRVYMMLFERRISDLMKEEVDAMDVDDESDRSVWKLAASRWRLPYWDWALNPQLPGLVCKETITIVTRWNAGIGQPSMEEVHNPMYSFRMPGGRPMGDVSYGDYRIDFADGLPFDLCKGTSRHGITWHDDKRVWINGFTDSKKVNAALEHAEWSARSGGKARHDTIKDAVQRLLNPSYNVTWEQFISTKYEGQEDDPKEYLSLEGIHNNLHNWIGGSDVLNDGAGAGHMGSVPVAAFDPVFWLHHCNIDRLIYLWQAIPENRDKWFSNTEDDKGDDAKTPLRPFRSPEDPVGFYNSDHVRSLKDLHYTYDDVVAQAPDAFLHGALPGDRPLAKRVNNLYGTELPESAQGADFVINVIYNRYALRGQRYAIHFFLGRLKPGVPHSQQENRVGSIYTFSSPFKAPDGSVRCPGCKKQADSGILSRAQIPILRAVLSCDTRVRTREEADEYLRDNLSWVAVVDSGTPITGEDLKDIKVTVLEGKFEARSSEDQWVRFGDHAPLEKATEKVQQQNRGGR